MAWRRHTPAVIGYVIALVWMTWPLPRACPDHLPAPAQIIGWFGWPYEADILHHVWVLAWASHVLVTHPSRLFDANVFYPAPDALAFSEHFLGFLPVALPVYLTTNNPVLAFNAALLTAYLGCALTMYAIAWRWTADRAAAFGAGLLYAFCTFRLFPAFALEVVGALYLPLLPLLLERWADRRRPIDLAGFVLCLSLQTLCSYYLGYMAFLVAGLSAAVLVGQGRLRGSSLALVAGGAAVGAAAVAALSVPYMRLFQGAVTPLQVTRPPLGGRGGASARLLALARDVFPGWPAAAVAALGLTMPPRYRGARLLSVLYVVAGLVLAWGPYARVAAWTVPLPAAWLRALLPGFSVLRFRNWFLSVTELGLAGLVGLGLVALRTPRRVGWETMSRLVAALAIAALGYHSAAVARMAVRPAPVGSTLPAVYRTLAARPEDGILLELPLGRWDVRGTYVDASYMVASSSHWKRLVNGYGAYTPATYDFLAAIAARLPDHDALQDLVDLVGLRWVIVHRAPGTSPLAWAAREQAGDVQRLAGDDGSNVLFEVRVPPRRDLLARVRAAARGTPTTTLTGTPLAPLPRAALQAEWFVSPSPMSPPPKATVSVRLAVTNRAAAVWPAWGVRLDGLVVVELRWLRAEDMSAARAGPIVRLPSDVEPGRSVTVEARLGAPQTAGRYVLEARLRQIGFEELAGEPYRLPITIQEPDTG